MPARQTSPIQLQSRRVLPGPGEGLAMGTRAAACKLLNVKSTFLFFLHFLTFNKHVIFFFLIILFLFSSVTAKIRNLLDYHLRLLHGIMPVPSGVDIANTLKYFSGTLLSK